MTDALLLVAVLVSVLVIGARIGRNNQIGRDGKAVAPMINPLQVLGEIVNALFPPRTPHPCPRCEALFDDEPSDWPRDLHTHPANDHTGYYEATTTCGQEYSAAEHPDDIVHGCYRDPGHTDLGRDDHACLCGYLWSAPKCECWTVEKPWTYYGITEPGGAFEFNPECPVHGTPTTVPAGVSAAPTAPSAGLCEHCQQPIEALSRLDAWFHTGSQRLPCAYIPGYPRTFAAPQM